MSRPFEFLVPLWRRDPRKDQRALHGVEASLHRLQTDHIDLYRIDGNDFVTPVAVITGARGLDRPDGG
jgi:aryl-alcohol dehydrogenase-like predicted oxidoreductase